MIVVQSSTDTFFTLLLVFFTLEEVTGQQQRTCGLGGGSSGGISGSGCRDRILLDNSFLITSSGILKKRKITCKQSSAQKELISRVHWQPKPRFQALLDLNTEMQCSPVCELYHAHYVFKNSPDNLYLLSVSQACAVIFKHRPFVLPEEYYHLSILPFSECHQQVLEIFHPH